MKPHVVDLRAVSRRRINPKVEALPPSGIRRFFDLVANTTGVISLGVGEPDFRTPWHICDAGIHSYEIGHTSYTSNSGILLLREVLSEYLKRKLHCEYDPQDELLITVGGSEALDLTFRALLEPGDEVLIIDPSFVSYGPLTLLAHGVPVRIPTTAEQGFAPSREQLERAITPQTRALLVNYPNNPTGAVLSREQAQGIADFVQRHNLFLISDEIYLPLSYGGDKVSFTGFPELHDRLVLIHGFSKAWAMTGWRLGFAAGPRDVIAAMTKIHQYSIMCASTAAQFAAVEALREGDEEVESMRQEYDRRRRFITHHLNRLGLDCYEPQGAFYVFPSIRCTGLSSEDFALNLLEEEKVAVVPGTAFGACGEGYIRCSYATALEELRQAVVCLERFLTRHPADS